MSSCWREFRCGTETGGEAVSRGDPSPLIASSWPRRQPGQSSGRFRTANENDYTLDMEWSTDGRSDAAFRRPDVTSARDRSALLRVENARPGALPGQPAEGTDVAAISSIFAASTKSL